MAKKAILILILQLALRSAFCANEASTGTLLARELQASYDAEAKNNYPLAIAPLQKLPPKESANYIVQLRLGWLSYCSQKYPESIAYYQKAIELEPEAIEPRLGLMLPMMAAGKNNEALEVAQAVLSRDSNNYTALSRVAWLHYLKQDYKKSAEIYRRLVAFYPSDTEMLLGLGYALKMGGEMQEAKKLFNKALLLSPNNSRALAGLE